MTISIIVPVYNEVSIIASVMTKVLTSESPFPRQWIVVDDSSFDGTYEVLLDLQTRFGFELYRLPAHKGKGAAVRFGLSKATGDFTLIQDADHEYDPGDIPRLVAPLVAGTADVVYGSRFQKGSKKGFHSAVNLFLTALSNKASGLSLTDMETCYKMLKTDLFKSMNLTSNRFGIEVEITAYLAKSQARIVEVPISYFPRTKLQNKKIGWMDGLAALWHILHFNFFVSVDKAFQKL